MNVWARHWFRTYLEAQDAVASFAAYELLANTLDGRAALWIGPQLKASPMEGELRSHWNANTARLNQETKRRSNELKDRLFATKTMARTQAPWL